MVSNYAENPGVQYFTKKFNMTIKFEHPPEGSEAETFNVMIATENYLTYSKLLTGKALLMNYIGMVLSLILLHI